MTRVHYPKPRRLNEELGSIKRVEKHRRMDCIFYEHCLDHADQFIYQSFSCKLCNYYSKSEISKQDRLAFEEMAKEILRNKDNGG